MNNNKKKERKNLNVTKQSNTELEQLETKETKRNEKRRESQQPSFSFYFILLNPSKDQY